MTSAFRAVPYALALVAALLLAGCGGGGVGETFDPGSVTPAGTASLTGQVVEVDGETTSLAGIQFELLETGQSVTTDFDGSFEFGEVPADGATLAIVDSSTALLVSATSSPGMGGDDDHGPGMGGDDHGPGMGGHDDDDHGMGGHHDDCDEGDGPQFGDGESLCDGDMHVHRAEDGDELHVRLRICDGEIEEMHTFRHRHEEHAAEIRMLRTESNDDPDMEGRLRLEMREGRERFRVRVEHATFGRDLELVVISPDGVEDTQGTCTVDAEGECTWDMDTSDGGRLPFAATSVEDLEGYEVEVRDFDTELALLTVTVPEMAPHMDDDDHMNGAPETDRTRGRMRLTSHVEGLEGYVEMRHRVSRDEERFSVEVEGLAAGQEVDIYIQDDPDAETFTYVGSMTADADGHAEMEIDTRNGDSLPHGVGHVSDLMGLELEVRDTLTGDVLLGGHAPAMMHDH